MSVNNQKQGVSGELIGVIPAAGTAIRLEQLPCSEKFLPVGFYKMRDWGIQPSPK
jgi:hypothetical protein